MESEPESELGCRRRRSPPARKNDDLMAGSAGAIYHDHQHRQLPRRRRICQRDEPTSRSTVKSSTVEEVWRVD